MQNRNLPGRVLGLLIEAFVCLAVATVSAQPPDLGLLPGGGQDGAGFQLGPSGGVLGEGDRAPRLDAGFTAPGSDRSAQLFIAATLPTGSHTYSITQPPGGPLPTVVKVAPSSDFAVGGFHSVAPPKIEHDDDAFPGLPLESHSGTVKWVATIRFAEGVRPETVKIQGKVNMQLCDANGCVQPKDYPFTAELRPDVQAVAIAGPPKPREAPVSSPSASPPPSVPSQNGPTTKPPAPQNTASPAAAIPVKPVEAARPRVATGQREIDWLPFTNTADLGQMVNPRFFDAEEIHENVRKQGGNMGIVGAILAGFVGGLILNVMPCVLPVIGLKILSFVEQAGHARRKAFMLNIWYSSGLLFVFFVLASLAVGPQHLGWGELFGKAWFTITLSAVVFVMALSFMGVWEVPLPTFLGGGKAGELAAQEGAVGAFFKGILTTFLATPCGAPIFASALVWATAQPAWLTYSVFLSAGLGMASPYLLVGAFPELLRFLPKPGAWMETFKQFMGFVLMGTVIYLLAVIRPQYVVPTLGLLFSLSFMCWWVGRISPAVDFAVRLRTWSQAAAVVCIVFILMFPGFNLGRFQLPGLVDVMARKFVASPTTNDPAARIIGPKTVLLAFSADWCQTCHYYESTVLDTGPVIDALRRLGVVTVKADWSDDSPAVSEMLDVLNSKQIPVVAIFSAQDPNHPSVFHAGYTQEEILHALEKAGPSPGAGT